MSSQNKEKVTINPFVGELQLINDLEMGYTVRNLLKASFFVKDGFTRSYPNLQVPVGKTADVQAGGELVIY